MKPLRHETDLVLSKTECEGERFRRDNLLFNTCFVFFFSDLASGFTWPPRSWNIYTLLKSLYYLCFAMESRTKRLCCGITNKARRNVL